jgi:hypothetical protein
VNDGSSRTLRKAQRVSHAEEIRNSGSVSDDDPYTGDSGGMGQARTGLRKVDKGRLRKDRRAVIPLQLYFLGSWDHRLVDRPTSS